MTEYEILQRSWGLLHSDNTRLREEKTILLGALKGLIDESINIYRKSAEEYYSKEIELLESIK